MVAGGFSAARARENTLPFCTTRFLIPSYIIEFFAGKGAQQPLGAICPQHALKAQARLTAASCSAGFGSAAPWQYPNGRPWFGSRFGCGTELRWPLRPCTACQALRGCLRVTWAFFLASVPSTHGNNIVSVEIGTALGVPVCLAPGEMGWAGCKCTNVKTPLSNSCLHWHTVRTTKAQLVQAAAHNSVRPTALYGTLHKAALYTLCCPSRLVADRADRIAFLPPKKQ